MTQKPPEPDAALESNLKALQFAIGDEAYRREHDRAAQWLLSHPDISYPRLLAMARDRQWTNPNAVLELLPRFGRADAVPVLSDVLEKDAEWVSWNAGRALAMHPLDAAREALERGLGSQRAATVIAASDGLMTRADRASCPALKRAFAGVSGPGRSHVLQAAVSLGCFDEAELSALRADPDEGVREIVERHDTSKP